ncbi:hypothetical protein BGZ63DRAFT_377672 [Mariannaea sp. PMI_226]|nr:hypothetical protein BGZ63DRAFT_377672 [Mariannaea sp. PMI_226]
MNPPPAPQLAKEQAPRRTTISRSTRTQQPRNNVRYEPYPGVDFQRPLNSMPTGPAMPSPTDALSPGVWLGTPGGMEAIIEESPTAAASGSNDNPPTCNPAMLNANFIDFDYFNMVEEVTDAQLEAVMASVSDCQASEQAEASIISDLELPAPFFQE